MRNLKKYLSVLLAVAMILTAMAPAFAAGFTYEAQGQALKSLGIIEGVSETDLGLGLDLNREQGIKVVLGLVGKLKAAEALTDADATAALANYTDVATVSGWAKKYVAYSVKNGIVNGMDATTLAPQVKLSGKMFATMILRNLGYTVNDNDYANAAGILAEKGALTATQALAFNNKDLIRDDMAAIAFGALKVKDAAGKTVIENLVAAGVVTEAKAVAAGLLTAAPTPTPVPFGVESVVATNLKEVVVTFNADVDEDEVDVSDFDVDGNEPAEVDVAGNVVTLTMADLEELDNDESYDITISGILDLNGEEMDEVEVSFTAEDNTLPSVTKIEFTGPQTVKITFSEPLDSGVQGEVTVDDGIYSGSDYAFDGNKVTVDIGTELDEGSHAFKIKGFKDYADYQMAAKTINAVYDDVTTAPTVTVKEITQKKITLTFDRPVKGLEAESFYHTYSTWQPLSIEDKDGGVIAVGDYKDEVVLIFADGVDEDADRLVPTGKVKIGIFAENENDVEIEDRWENTLADDVVLYSTVEADSTAPTVSKIEVKDESRIEITFSEEIDTTEATKEDNYTITNADGDVLESYEYTATINADGDVVTITFDDPQDAGEYTIKIEDMKDTSLSENEMNAVTKTFTIEDETAIDMTLDVDVSMIAADRTIFVKYPEKMATSGAGSVINPDNYLYAKNNVATLDELDSDVKVTLFTDKIVKLVFPSDFAPVVDEADLVIGRVADLDGNYSTEFSNTYADIAEEEGPVVTQIKKVAENKLEIKVNQELKSVSAEGIVVNGNGDGPANDVAIDSDEVAAISFVNDGDDTIIKVTLKSAEKSVGTAGLDDKATVTIVASKIKSVTGAYAPAKTYADTVLAAGVVDVSVKDGFAPELDENADDDAMVYAYNLAGNNLIDTIYIKYSEAIDDDSVSKYTYVVSGYDVDSVAVNGAWVILTVENSDDDETNDLDATPTVTQKYDIEDVSGNSFLAEDSAEAFSAEESATDVDLQAYLP